MTIKVTLLVYDLALIKAVLYTLGEISGEEMEQLAVVEDAITPWLEQHEITGYTQRPDRPEAEVALELAPVTAAMILNPLMSKVKAFRYTDRGRVQRIRQVLRQALKDEAQRQNAPKESPPAVPDEPMCVDEVDEEAVSADS